MLSMLLSKGKTNQNYFLIRLLATLPKQCSDHKRPEHEVAITSDHKRPEHEVAITSDHKRPEHEVAITTYLAM